MAKKIAHLALTLLCATALTAHARNASTCYGSHETGRLQQGWQLPNSGPNFNVYSTLGSVAGRNYVHSQVYQVVLDAYQTLAQQLPSNTFVYGETGTKNGGRFKPHKTHQNGLSVDFFVPVIDQHGKSVALPTSVRNKWGYGIEFVGKGQYQQYRIDYNAMAQHLWALHQAAQKHGITIRRVIFDNALQNQLFQSPAARNLKNTMTFSQKKPWVRHDEHYHVDFIVPCKPL